MYTFKDKTFTSRAEVASYFRVSPYTVAEYCKKYGKDVGLVMLSEIPSTHPKILKMGYTLDGKVFDTSKQLAEYLGVSLMTVSRWRRIGLNSEIDRYRNKGYLINGHLYKTKGEIVLDINVSYNKLNKYSRVYGVERAVAEIQKNSLGKEYTLGTETFKSMKAIADRLGINSCTFRYHVRRLGNVEKAVERIKEIRDRKLPEDNKTKE